MKIVLLSDFGSTYTKLTAVDLDAEEVLACSAAYTTVETDVQEGYFKALGILQDKLAKDKEGTLERLVAEGKITEADRTLAQNFTTDDVFYHKSCSSAAGGLRMLVSGLVPELTAKAAKLAALGAGAKVLKTYDHELTDDDLEEIAEIKPDIFLLTGGTDGGNKECILENAEALCDLAPSFPIVVAGNRTAQRKIRKMFEEAGLHFVICDNVMPQLGTLNILPVQEQIRAIFLERIVKAKGLSHIKAMVQDIIMPTPASILSAVSLLADGTEDEKGLGEILALDPGGATTDVYSVATGAPSGMDVVMRGLPEPYKKRTVEGDIGMRYSIRGIVEAAGLKTVAKKAGLTPEKTQAMVDDLAAHTDHLPQDAESQALDDALAYYAVQVGVKRHCGTLEEFYTSNGKVYCQTGKDLRNIDTIVVTGGALVRAKNTKEIAQGAFYDESDPASLRPVKAKILIDRKYIMSAMGVLSHDYPEKALRIMKKELVNE